MPATTIYLIRHSTPQFPIIDGQRVYYGPDAPLSEEGREKALARAEQLLASEGRPFDALFSSPMIRAFQTAWIIADRMQISTVTTLKGFGDTHTLWPGTPMDELSKVVQAGRLFDDSRTLETMEGIADRMTHAYQQVVRASQGKLVGVVSHADPLRILYHRILHPGESFPPYGILMKEINIDLADAIRVEIAESGQLSVEKVS